MRISIYWSRQVSIEFIPCEKAADVNCLQKNIPYLAIFPKAHLVLRVWGRAGTGVDMGGYEGNKKRAGETKY